MKIAATLLLLLFQLTLATVAVGQCTSFQANAFGPSSGCVGESVILSAVPSPYGGTFTYQWKKNGSNISGATGVVYHATESGNYTVYMERVGCSNISTSSVHAVNFVGPPDLTIGFSGSGAAFPDGSGGWFICGDKALLANTSTGVTFLWKKNGTTISGATTSSCPISGDGTYAVTTENSVGCSTTKSISLALKPIAVASLSASGPTSFCEGESVVLTTPSSSNYTYEWKRNGSIISGANQNSYTATQSGTYTVTVQNGYCYPVSSFMSVAVNSLPEATITPAGSTTTCGTDVVLNANYGTGFTYAWTRNGSLISGATADDYTATQSGTYRVIVTNSSDCAKTSSGTVVTIKEVPVAEIAASTTTPCIGDALPLLSASATSGVQWIKGSTDIAGATSPTYNPTSSGTYRVRITANGCSNTSDPKIITFTAPPNLTIGFSGTGTAISDGSGSGYYICGNMSLLATTNTGISFLWKKNGTVISGETTTSCPINGDGTYSLTATNDTGCTTTKAIFVAVKPVVAASLSASGPTTFCEGESVVLSTPADSDYTFQWSRNGSILQGASQNSYEVTESGSYTVTVENGYCYPASSTMSVTVNPLPGSVITATGPTATCGANVTLDANAGSGFSYQWKQDGNVISGATASSFIANESGDYSVVITNSAGCSSVSDETSVTIGELPPAFIAASDTDPCFGEEFFLTSSYREGDQIQWINVVNGSENDISGENAIMFYPEVGGTYRVRITAPDGCSKTSDPKVITVRSYPSLTIGYSGPNPVVHFGVDSAMVCGYTALTGITDTGETLKWMNGPAQPVTTTFPVDEDGTYTVSTENAYGCATEKTVKIDVTPLPDARIWISGSTELCEGNDVTLTSSFHDTYHYEWVNETNTPLDTTTEFHVYDQGLYRLKVNDGLCLSYSDTVEVLVNPVPLALITPSGPTSTCGDSLTLHANVLPLASYQWFDAGNAITTATNDSLNVDESGTYSVTVTLNGCTATANPLSVDINTNPEIAVSGSTRPCNGNPPQFTVNPAQDIRWLKDGVVMPNETSTIFTPSSDGSYRARITDDGCVDTTSVVSITFADCINYIRQKVAKVKGIVTEGTLQVLTIDSMSVSTAYFDGLGRSVQSVSKQSSPGLKDMVQPITYDEFGRERLKYLPLAAGNDGGYKEDIIDPVTGAFTGIASTFYAANSNNAIADDTRPFSEIIYDQSPLNRVMRQYGPGELWGATSSDKFIGYQHTTNHFDSSSPMHEAIIAWVIGENGLPVRSGTIPNSIETGGYYSSGQLLIKTISDEEGNETREYTDKRGRVILEKVQAVTSPGLNNKDHWAQTYYVYDNGGNLRYVLQPELSKLIHRDDIYNPTISDLKNFAFCYDYDGRKRMIRKIVPGADTVYLVYDDRDRLVLTQDGNQRLNSLWTFTKYDALNRPILTGIKDTVAMTEGEVPEPRPVTRAEMQEAINAHYAKPGAVWGEKFDPAEPIHGYTNRTYPVFTSDTLADPNHYLTVIYYDNYDFRDLWIDSYPYQDEQLSQSVNGALYEQPAEESSRVIGQVTGSKVKVLDGGARGGYTWLKSVNYYDEKYRLVQTVSDNYKGGQDILTTLYDFTGKVLKGKTRHSSNEISWTDLIKTVVSGNSLTRTATGDGWNAGAVTVEKLPAGVDGWIECIITEPDQMRAFGLSAQNQSEHRNTIDYAFWHDGTNAGFIEDGNEVYALNDPLESGDVIRIARAGTQVSYYKNGVLLYNSQTPSTTSLIGDVSIHSGSGNILIPRASFNAKADSIQRRFVYDHAGRLTEVWHQVNQAPEVRIAYNEYNELGQLIDKKLHSTTALASNAVQSIDYRYNIRGWLTDMNEDDLAGGDAGDPSDYFSFQLGYNTDIGIQNTPMYNGNVSGMKWSSNLGLTEEKMRAYRYSYDNLNRIMGAEYRTASGSVGALTWSTPGDDSFSASGYSYDLNGNILGLSRKGKSGSDLDVLIYEYGEGTAQSNQLLKVSDAGLKDEGFTEGLSEGDDYVYDSNGNLVWDKNKGGKELLTNGDFSNGSANWVVNDPGTRFSFQDDSLKITPHATASASLRQNGIILPGTGYVVIVDMVREAGSISINVGGSGNTLVNSSGKTVLSFMSESANDFVVNISKTFSGRINSIEVKGIVVIAYNYLNFPEFVSRGPGQQLRYIYDATGRKISQEVYDEAGLIAKKSDYAGEFFYENDTLRFINHEEGRVVMEGGVPEYQYYLKDIWGNVRLTFTTKTDQESSTGTLETANAAIEQSQFLRYENARKVQSTLFDKTNGTTTGYSERLNGSANEKYGLAKSFSVMPGDTISMEVYAKYVDTDSENLTQALIDFLAAISNGTAPAGTVVDGAGYATSTSSFSYAGLLNTSGSSGNGPKAYLNWLIFDRDYNFVNGGYQRMSDIAKEQGQDVAHEKLSASVPITEPGYMYVYLSNEDTSPVEVYFDDFQVAHAKSPIISMDDYYPFGLAYNSHTREGSLENKIKFQGQERITDLGLNWDAFKYRNYMPEIGRFFNIDPLAEEFVYNSPFAFAENKLGQGIELEGRELLPFAAASRAGWMTRLSRTLEKHHLIPRQFKGEKLIEYARRDGFKFEGKENKIEIERFSRRTGKGRHGNHPNYNERVGKQLKELHKENPKPKPGEAGKIVKDLAKGLEELIKANPETKINDLFRPNGSGTGAGLAFPGKVEMKSDGTNTPGPSPQQKFEMKEGARYLKELENAFQNLYEGLMNPKRKGA